MGKFVLSLVLSLIMGLYLYTQQQDASTQGSQVEQEVKLLVQKLDSDDLNERDEVYKKILKLAETNDAVLEMLKKELDNSINSANTKFMLKRLINQVKSNKDKEKDKNKSKLFDGKVIINQNLPSVIFRTGGIKPFLGIKGLSINSSEFLSVLKSEFNMKYKDLADFLNSVGLDNAKGIFIVETVKDTSAEKTLRAGDIILKLDDIEITDLNALNEKLEKSFKPNDVVKLQILRNKSLQEVKVTLGQQEPSQESSVDLKEIIGQLLNKQNNIENVKNIIIASLGQVQNKQEQKIKDLEERMREIEKNIKDILEKVNKIEGGLKK